MSVLGPFLHSLDSVTPGPAIARCPYLGLLLSEPEQHPIRSKAVEVHFGHSGFKAGVCRFKLSVQRTARHSPSAEHPELVMEAQCRAAERERTERRKRR